MIQEEKFAAHKEIVVKDALRITAVLNKHLSEPDCKHSVREIAVEAFQQ